MGGIEWNFPTRGHAVHTFSPVQYRVVEGDDGSVTCVVGTREWVRRMKWAGQLDKDQDGVVLALEVARSIDLGAYVRVHLHGPVTVVAHLSLPSFTELTRSG